MKLINFIEKYRGWIIYFIITCIIGYFSNLLIGVIIFWIIFIIGAYINRKNKTKEENYIKKMKGINIK
jgi:hypothetical protein